MALPQVGVEAVISGLGKFQADSAKVNRAFADMDTAASAVGRSAVGLSGHITDLGTNLLKFGALAGGVVLGGVTALSAGLATFAVGGIKQAIGLDQQVANIAATMGATKETAGTLKEELKGLALDLSLDPNLTVNVTQAGEAIEVLAANGAIATDEFGKLTEASKTLATQTVALANATGSNFETAATIATDAANLFGVEVEEMGKVIDGAAGVMNASKFDAEDYRLALAAGGAVAAGYGISLEDFNTILAGTASNFSSGSDAGTSFKALLQRLAAPTDEMKAVMEQYGISLFDANGEMRDMKDVAADLNQVFNGTVTITETVGGATKKQASAAATASKNMQGLKDDIAANQAQLQLYNEKLALEIGYYGESHDKARQRKIQIQKLSNTIADQNGKLAEYEGAIAAVDGAQEKVISSTVQLTEAQKAELATTLGGADGARILMGLAGMTADEFDKLSASVNKSGQGLEAAALRVDTVQGAMDIFKGVLEAIQIQVGDKFLPLIKQVAVNFTRLATQAGPVVVDFFGQVADKIGATITAIGTGIDKASRAFANFGVRGAAVSILGQLGFSPEEISQITPTVDAIIAAVNRVFTAFEAFGARGAAFSIMGLLGFSSDTMVTINTVVEGIIATVSSLGSQLATILSGISFDEVVGALMGIGAVLAGGVFAALVAGLMSLLTPINLIIAAAALLGAAWAGNWLNIQGITFQAIATITELFNQFMALWQTWWPIIQATALTAWTVLQGIFAGFQAALGPVVSQLSTQFAQIGAQLAALGINWQAVWNALLQATGIVAAAIGAALLGIIGLVAGLAAGIGAGISTAITVFQALVPAAQTVLEGFTTVIAGWIAIVQGIMAGDFAAIWEGVKTTMGGILTFWEGTFSGLLTITGGFVSVISSTIGGFVQGIWDFFKGLYDNLVGNSLIPDLVNGITDWFKRLPQLITSALSNLPETVGAVFEEMLERAKTLLSPEEWLEIGEGIMSGLLEGIKANSGAVLEYMKTLLGDFISTFTGGLQMHSPSLLFQGFGSDIMMGLIGGIDMHDGEFQNSFIDALNLGGIAKSLGIGSGGWKVIRKALHHGIKANIDVLLQGAGDVKLAAQQFAAGFNVPPSVVDNFSGFAETLIETFEDLRNKMLMESLGEAAGLAGQFAGIGGQFVSMLTADDKEVAERMKLFKDFLKSGEQWLTFEQDGLDVTINRSLAQQELNRLTKEQREEQAKILKLQEQQQKLDFLKSQLDLINLIQERGLDPGALLGGLTLGLNASADDLLQATTNIVEAMVAQINQQLQIHSPSGVMETIGRQMMAGLGVGWQAMVPNLTNQLSASIAAPVGQVAGPVAAGATNYNYYQTFSTGGNNIASDYDAAAFEARVLQVIRQNL